MIPNSLDDFIPYVKSLWPSYKCEPEQVRVLSRWDDWLCHVSIDTIQAALKQVRREHPNETRPDWKQVFRLIHENGRGSTRNDFDVLLNGVRTVNQKHGSDNWSDGEAWQVYVDANRGNAKGQLYYWTNYLRDIGARVPEFLEEKNG